jgi:5-methylcytosine-specific restriction endonuclease McrA
MPPGWANRRRLVLERDGHRCQMCGALATEVDHIQPRAQGGSDELANLRSLCRPCHAMVTYRRPRKAMGVTGEG